MGQGYFETMEIQVIMSFLKVIDNPMQDIPLISVLRSPIYGFTPEDFIDIRTVDKKVSFYEANGFISLTFFHCRFVLYYEYALNH